MDIEEDDYLGFESERFSLYRWDTLDFLYEAAKSGYSYDLIVSSPPYNIGKVYEKRKSLDDYLEWMESVVEMLEIVLNPGGHVCWQVGFHLDSKKNLLPLEYVFDPMFRKTGLKMRNRIVWQFGHGLHAKNKFSGRHEAVMWYTKGDDYHFDLDPVRVPQKYPGKRHQRGPKKGQYSSNPLGKNPGDVWDIPNVKYNHPEKLDHPCQFPVGLVEKLVLSMTREGEHVMDPFAGVMSTGVAALAHNRQFTGVERDLNYVLAGKNRLEGVLSGATTWRPHDKPIMTPSGQFAKRDDDELADQET